MMSATTGRAMDEAAHIRQSIRDILTTRVGSRVMRRDYGSLVPELIDQPANPITQMRLRAATVMAVLRWEPRIQINRCTIAIGYDGGVDVQLDAQRRDGPRAGSALSLTVPVAA